MDAEHTPAERCAAPVPNHHSTSGWWITKPWTGVSLKNVAKHFNVNETTIRNEFTRAGIQVRPRRGWNSP